MLFMILLHNVLPIIKLKMGTYLFIVNIFVEISFYQVNCMHHLQPNSFWPTCKQFGKFQLYLLFKSIFLLYNDRGRHLVNKTRLFCSCFVQVCTKCAYIYT